LRRFFVGGVTSDGRLPAIGSEGVECGEDIVEVLAFAVAGAGVPLLLNLTLQVRAVVEGGE
jgi:hypothetical protein